MSLLAGGYVQITPPSFGQEAELLFSFSSNNQSGVLLAAFSNDRSHKQVRPIQVTCIPSLFELTKLCG